MNKAFRWALFAVVAIALGAIAGAFTWAFFFLMNNGIALVWDVAPQALGAPWWYPIVMCTLGGLCLGLFAWRFGAYPESLNTVLAQVKETGRYDYRHLGSSFIGALLPLLFGGSIGPEAGLTGVVAGLCTWVGDRLRRVGSEFRELSSVGVSAVISAVFAAPLFGLAVPLVGSADGADVAGDEVKVTVPRATKVAVYLCAVAGAFGVMLLLRSLFGSGGGLPRFTGIEVGARELAWGVPLALAGACVGLLYHASGAAVRAVALRMSAHPVAKAVVAGVLLGCAGAVLPLTMFAGEEQAGQLEQMWMGMSAGVLIATGIVKVCVTNVCLGLGWRGGHFFPVIFAGLCLGYGFSLITGADPVFCLCACTAGLMGCVMRQPLMAALLLFLCFPLRGVLVMLVAAAIGSAVPVPHSWIETTHASAASAQDAEEIGGGAGEKPEEPRG